MPLPGALTSRQRWRRQRIASRHIVVKFDIEQFERRQAVERVQFALDRAKGQTGSGRPAAIGDALTDSGKQAQFGKKKSVIFSARVHVVLIPNIGEYIAAGLSSYLWWTEDDYKIFKQDALEELRIFMDHRDMSSTKDALKIIYQQSASPPCVLVDDPLAPKRTPVVPVAAATAPAAECNSDCSHEHIDLRGARSAIQRFFASGLTYRPSVDKSFGQPSRPAGDQIHPLALICT